MSSLLDNHQAKEGSRAAQGDPPGKNSTQQLERDPGDVVSECKGASQGSSGSAEGPAASSAFTL